MIITDVRQPEAITDAQVTKVANSSADTKSAAEETPQMPKKVSIKMLIFSSKHTFEKKKTVRFGLQPWYTERLSGHHAVHLSPTRGHKRTIDKTSFLEPFAQKRLKVNKCDLKPWVPSFMLQFHPLQTCRIINLSACFSSSSSLQGIVLNNAKSWAQLMKQPAAPTAIKTSKNVFEQFRKAALEKEQRQKAMRLHQVDWSREWKAPQSNWYVPESSCSN